MAPSALEDSQYIVRDLLGLAQALRPDILEFKSWLKCMAQVWLQTKLSTSLGLSFLSLKWTSQPLGREAIRISSAM